MKGTLPDSVEERKRAVKKNFRAQLRLLMTSPDDTGRL
jgi:hypothetical protein